MPYAMFCGERVSSSPVFLREGKQFVSNRAARFWSNRESSHRYAPEAFIGLELSLVPEVELVFVELVQKRRAVGVVAIVNDRSPDTRMRVYAREQSIIDAFPNLDFSFRVVARMNRDLSDILDRVGKLAYQR